MITERCPPPDNDERELSRVALAERLEYAMAAAAGFVSGTELTPDETRTLQRLCEKLDLPDRETQWVLEAARTQGGKGADPCP